MCIGTTNNNSAIVRKVVSKTVINCSCAFWYTFWSKPQTRKYILKQVEELDLPSSVFVNWLVSIYKSQTFIMWYMYIFWILVKNSLLGIRRLQDKVIR